MEEKQLTSKELEEQANALLAEADFEEIKLPKKAKKAAAAKKAAEEASIALEIRLNGRSDHILQQKRLNLLSNILAGRGVDSNKIRVVYTVREPNSFVMRTIRINEQSNETTMKNNTPNNNGYYLQW